MFGYAGGVFEALLIAAINIVIGAVVGRFLFPWLSYRNVGVRILAGISTLIYLAAAAGFNIAVAHYRNAVAGDPFEASRIAFEQLITNTFGIADLQSWGLFLVGFIFSLAAAYDGLRMDDPYPGYGHRVRQNLEALDDYNDLKDELLEELDEIKSDAEEALDETVRSIQTRQAEYSYIVMKSQALKTEMLQHFSHLESAANTLLQYYRDENRRCRSTPAPGRFEDTWTHLRPALDGEIVSKGSQENLDGAVKKAFEDAPRQRERLHAAYRMAYAEYKRIDDLVDPGEGHEAQAATA